MITQIIIIILWVIIVAGITFLIIKSKQEKELKDGG